MPFGLGKPSPGQKGNIAFGLNAILLNIKYCSILFYKVVNNFPHYDKIVSPLRENINIFINVTYLYMLHVCIYKIHNMIRLFCTKVKFHIKYMFENN